MSLAQSMWTGLTGVREHQRRLDVIGNNLANTNTTAYKADQHSFQDLFSLSLRGAAAPATGTGSINPVNVGLGASTGSIDKVYTQGPLQDTGHTLDFAIEGNGFFVATKQIQTADGFATDTYYTRDGAFYLHADAIAQEDGTVEPKQLLVGDGLSVMGYPADENGNVNIDGTMEALAIPMEQPIAGNVTTQIALEGNIPSGTQVAQGNTIPTGTDTTWVSDNSSTLNVGLVETSRPLYDGNTEAAATAGTDLVDLQYLNSLGDLRAPFEEFENGDTVTVAFTRGGVDEEATFVYGQAGTAYTIGEGEGAETRVGSGTTLEDFATWMTGGLGDDGTETTSRLDGGALGTIRTAASGNAPAEQAGAYLRNYEDTDAEAVDYDPEEGEGKDPTTRLSIASNVGASNTIRDIKVRANDALFIDLFDFETAYSDITEDDSVSRRVTSYETVDGAVVERELNLSFSLVDRTDDTSTWRWVAEGTDAAGQAQGDPNRIENAGLVTFDGLGQATSSTSEVTGGIAFNFDSLVQLATATNIEIAEQDGYPDGYLKDFSVSTDGLIHGHYSNGRNETLGQIGQALIPNPDGLRGAGENLYKLTPASGEAAEWTGRGSVRQGFLEQSNVQFQQELTNIIVTQRGYQSNARVISTTNEMLQELVQLKR